MKKLLLVFGFLTLFSGFVLAQTEHPTKSTAKTKMAKHHHKKTAPVADSTHVKNTTANKKAKKN